MSPRGLTGQAEHVNSTCRRQGRGAKRAKEMLRLVEADEVGFPMGTRMGDAAGLYGGPDINQCHVSGQATFFSSAGMSLLPCVVRLCLCLLVKVCGCVGVCQYARAQAAKVKIYLMRCDDYFCCTRNFVGVRACLSSADAPRCLVSETNQGSWELGWHLSHSHRIANAHPSHSRCIAYLALKTDLPSSALHTSLLDASALGCATDAGGKESSPRNTRHGQRSGAAEADHCQSDNLKVQTIGSVGLGYLHLVCMPPWLMGKKKWRALR